MDLVIFSSVNFKLTSIKQASLNKQGSTNKKNYVVND